VFLGDVIINLNKASEQAKEYNHSLSREVCYLFVHGLLHLLGYDHIEDKDKKLMRSKEELILNKFKLTR
jgi:probable rRNA maturation factor